MRKPLAIGLAVAAAGALAGIAPGVAGAADCSTPTTPNVGCTVTVSAAVGGTGLTGVRTLGPVLPVALAGTSSLTGALTVPVTETAALGANPWSVTAIATNLSDGGTNTIPAAGLTVADTTLPTSVGCLVLSQCTVSSPSSRGALSSTQTLFSVTGESSSVAYTGVYTYAGLMSLAVPNGTPTGAYTGTMTLTLVQ